MVTKRISVSSLLVLLAVLTVETGSGRGSEQQGEGWGASILGIQRPESIERFEISASNRTWLVVAVQLSPPKSQKELRFSEIAVVDGSGIRYAVVSFGLARMTLSGPRLWDTTRDPQFALTREEMAKSTGRLVLEAGEPPPRVLLFEIGSAAEGLILQVGREAKSPLK